MKRTFSENLERAYSGRRVIITGHTGFKGSWLTLWLSRLGANVTGYSLSAPTDPSLFEAANLSTICSDVRGDVRDIQLLVQLFEHTQPEFLFHLAAQPIVRTSFADPLETISTNVMGTAHVLEAVRRARCRCAVIVVTSDKCYENREWPYAYRENDPMGGHDPYSMSKGAAELITSSYQRSFFPVESLESHGVALATARAGNVIGGGDWARDRLVPDAIRGLLAGRPIEVRNPLSVRPWQHVLEPLGGYLTLAARLADPDTLRRSTGCGAWNFGPAATDAIPVSTIVDRLVDAWGKGHWTSPPARAIAPHEAGVLRLAIDKAVSQLGWHPRWDIEKAVRVTVDWYKQYHSGARDSALREVCLRQIACYSGGEAEPLALRAHGVARTHQS